MKGDHDPNTNEVYRECLRNHAASLGSMPQMAVTSLYLTTHPQVAYNASPTDATVTSTAESLTQPRHPKLQKTVDQDIINTMSS
ncbi:hypothetical protein ACFX11_030916 [Malus domestica]